MQPILSTSPVSCSGSCNGSALAGQTGGAAPFTYLWTPSNQNFTKCNRALRGHLYCDGARFQYLRFNYYSNNYRNRRRSWPPRPIHPYCATAALCTAIAAQRAGRRRSIMRGATVKTVLRPPVCRPELIPLPLPTAITVFPMPASPLPSRPF